VLANHPARHSGIAPAALENEKQVGDNERTLNLYFVSTPSYTLFAEIFSNTIVEY
jgi:hypothetical protein